VAPALAPPALRARSTLATLYAAASAARPDAAEELCIDGPVWVYWAPFAWLWLPYQGVVVANQLLLGSNLRQFASGDNCLAFYLTCRRGAQPAAKRRAPPQLPGPAPTPPRPRPNPALTPP
jgi:hypothetical protein